MENGARTRIVSNQTILLMSALLEIKDYVMSTHQMTRRHATGSWLFRPDNENANIGTQGVQELFFMKSWR